jgi:two-component system, OmpR family, KDP operon response regulator KdpE
MPRVLVVDDEPQLVRALAINLRARKYQVDAAQDGAGALQLAAGRHPDVIILDLGLPDMDGVDVIKGLRGWTRVPIIVLSARHASEEKVDALDAGADDYVTKPFGSEELLARMRAVLRRRSEDGDGPVRIGELEVDLADRSVKRAGEEVHLTPIEFDLLGQLAQHPGRLVTHRQLLQEVWGPGYEDETHYLRVHFAHVRAKLEPDPSNPRYVITEPGIGYRLRVEQ